MKSMKLRVVAVASVLAIGLLPAVKGQDSEAELRREIEDLKQGQAEITRQLQEIKKLLESRPAAAPVRQSVKGRVFDLGTNPVKGASTAKLTLVEFTDYQ